MKPQFKNVFKKGSKTYFTSSLFFPQQVRDDVSILYAFVRKADDYVDCIPPKKKQFMEFKNEYLQIVKGHNRFITAFRKLEAEKGFNPDWTKAFLSSMEMDLTKKTYQTLAETEHYIYGSANVIGLYMAKLLNLPHISYPCAELLGKSMQFINFIRDIKEDLALGRNYFPQPELKQFGLRSLDYKETSRHPDALVRFVRFQIERYFKWQKEAEKGFVYIPKRYLVPIKTASNIYLWTAKKIYNDPFIVYRRKVKPNTLQILFEALKNLV
ncbi:phytoene/squalene synthase family protein [Candidatus Roizmanbacteria bacterium]|nr:phytoene/squalene synthase family protein [Candidatus Roizmanbacteria bacterium]